MISFLIFIVNFAYADLCKEWDSSQNFGNVPEIADEASGIIYSRQFRDRLYHVNDGKKPLLIVSNIEGTKAKEISIEGVNLQDIEDLAYGRCPDQKDHCIYVGDIGDNDRDRPFIQVIVVREEKEFADSVKPLAVYRMQYPDHPHNAEALAIHPDGALYIATKEKSKGEAHPTEIFKNSISKPEKKLSFVGEIDVPYLSHNRNADDQVVTGMTISDNGKKFILMSYKRAWEFNLDLSQPITATKKMRQGVDYQPIQVKQLTQQEAITYLPDQRSFIYSTESGKNHLVSGQSINIVRCSE